MEQQDILSMTLPELQAAVQELSEPKFRAKQIFNWLHQKRVTDFSEMTTLSLPFRERLASDFCINRLKIAKRLASSVDDTVKYLYELPDGNYVETVCMQYHHGTSLCISTQVGCRMGCRFCASAIAGFVRNLTPAEMLLQIYETERAQNCKISSLVLMGIGEPLDNFDNVLRFLQLLSDPNRVWHEFAARYRFYLRRCAEDSGAGRTAVRADAICFPALPERCRKKCHYAHQSFLSD